MEIATAFADKIGPMFESLERKIEESKLSGKDQFLIALLVILIQLALTIALVRLGVPLGDPP